MILENGIKITQLADDQIKLTEDDESYIMPKVGIIKLSGNYEQLPGKNKNISIRHADIVLILENLTINGGSIRDLLPIEIYCSTVKIVIRGKNTLKGFRVFPGLLVYRSEVTIEGPNEDDELKVYGGSNAVGIELTDNSTFQLNSGKIMCQGGKSRPGIGNEPVEKDAVPNTITINGGLIKCGGGKGAPGMGSCNQDFGTIKITGGTVLAYGDHENENPKVPDIGASGKKGKGTIEILGGKVYACNSGIIGIESNLKVPKKSEQMDQTRIFSNDSLF